MIVKLVQGGCIEHKSLILQLSKIYILEKHILYAKQIWFFFQYFILKMNSRGDNWFSSNDMRMYHGIQITKNIFLHVNIKHSANQQLLPLRERKWSVVKVIYPLDSGLDLGHQSQSIMILPSKWSFLSSVFWFSPVYQFSWSPV